MVDYIGYFAAFLGTICWIPQTIKTWRTRETKDLSLWANVLVFSTVVMWLLYGILLGSLPLIIANLVAVILVGSIVIAKLIYK